MYLKTINNNSDGRLGYRGGIPPSNGLGPLRGW